MLGRVENILLCSIDRKAVGYGKKVTGWLFGKEQSYILCEKDGGQYL